MYRYEAVVRYSETGGRLQADAAAVANFLQDCAILESESVGVGIEYLAAHNRAWFLISWQILVDRYPALGEKIVVRTWAYDFKGSMGYRNIEIVDGKGRSIVRVASIWSYMDILQLRPVKIDEEVAVAYQLAPKLDMTYAPRKIPLLENAFDAGKRQVMHYQIDSNHHMNNSAYIALALEFVNMEGKTIREIRAEYKKQFVKDDEIFVKKAVKENRCQIVFLDAEGQIGCTVLFETEEA